MTQFWQPTTASVTDHLPSKKAQNGLLQAVARHEARLSVLDREIIPRQLAQHADTALSSLPSSLEASLEQASTQLGARLAEMCASCEDGLARAAACGPRTDEARQAVEGAAAGVRQRQREALAELQAVLAACAASASRAAAAAAAAPAAALAAAARALAEGCTAADAALLSLIHI